MQRCQAQPPPNQSVESVKSRRVAVETVLPSYGEDIATLSPMHWQAITRKRRNGVAATLAAVATLTAVMAPWQHEIGLLNEGLLLLLLTLLISSTWGREVGLFAAVVSNLALNFFFVEPLHTLTVQSPENVLALFVFLGVSIIGSQLLATARASTETARRREAETQVLLSLSRAMIGQTEPADALAALCREVVAAFDAPGASVLSPVPGGWRVLGHAGSAEAGRYPDAQERTMAEQAAATGRIARIGHTGLERTRRVKIVSPTRHRDDTASQAAAFVPLTVGDRTLGILRLDGPIGDTLFAEQPDSLLAAFAGEAALGVQRAELAQDAAHADALRQADEMKTALMTSISHDLKTPLTGIKTAVSSLLDTTVAWSAEDHAAFLETIDSQADRLNRVISDILDLNRIESGVIAPARRPVDVAALFDDVRERTAMVTDARTVSASVPPRTTIHADESLVAQALVNLVENAAKYSTPGLPIHLSATTTGDTVEIVVADEGPGIARRDLPHVFERFYRAQEGSARVKGSGLGLAIVKGFIDLSGGTVRVESTPATERTAAGTRFIITLPRGEQARATA